MTEMHCQEFVELVTAFLDGTLDSADHGRVLAHLSLCDGCSRYLDQVRVTIAALASQSVENPLDREVTAALLDAFRTRAVDEDGEPV